MLTDVRHVSGRGGCIVSDWAAAGSRTDAMSRRLGKEIQGTGRYVALVSPLSLELAAAESALAG